MASPVQLIESRRFGDDRGWFTEVYKEPDFAARGITERFVQDNDPRSPYSASKAGADHLVSAGATPTASPS